LGQRRRAAGGATLPAMPARLRLALFVAGLLAIAAIAGVLLFAVGEKTVPPSSGFAGATRPPDIPPADFGVRDENGRPLRLIDLRGTPVVVTFLYTTCEDTCPLTAQQIRLALDDLGYDVPVIAVSVDPANDTPRRARSFALRQSMHGRMRWALGEPQQLTRIWKAYGIQPQTADEEHTAATVLLDARGVQRVGFSASVLTPEGLAHDIALLRREARERGDGATASPRAGVG
jgi:protein SCO1/2